jgi:Nucleoside-diphosphate-sugar epimerases
MHYLVTGAAGFIGFYVAERLLAAGHQVTGLDNLNDYYDVNLKLSRLELLQVNSAFRFVKGDLADRNLMAQLFVDFPVIHLGAQAGVRYSLDNPHAYADANLVGHLNILEGCRQHKIEHLLYASSSSVYGLNRKTPFSTTDSVDHPVSLYAATKKANELMSHSYAHLYGLPCTGLRFFTVYGPWGRPDMALFKFTKAILAGQPIDVYNFGEMKRDFTFIDDIAEAIIRLADIIPESNSAWTVETGSPAESSAPYRVYNIGNSQPIELKTFIHELELALGIPAKMNLLPLQPGDMLETSADTSALETVIGYKPQTQLASGLARFVSWYKTFYSQ